MSMLEQLVSQLRFMDCCSSDYQAAIAKDLAVNLPYNDRGHHAVSTLGANDPGNHFSVGLRSWRLSPSLPHKITMPRSVTRSPRSKMQALCLKTETHGRGRVHQPIISIDTADINRRKQAKAAGTRVSRS